MGTGARAPRASPAPYIGALALGLLLWRLSDLVFLTVAGLLLAVPVIELTRRVERALPFGGYRTAYALVLVSGTTPILVAGVILAPRIAVEIAALRQGLPVAMENLERELGRYGWGRALMGDLPVLGQLDLLGDGVLGRLSACPSRCRSPCSRQ